MRKNILFEKKTPGGTLRVVDTVLDDEAVSFLFVNDTYQSAMYLSEEKKYDLVFPYMRRFDYAFFVNPEIKNTFLIGGGGFAYPKFYVHMYENAEITVSEINTDVISVAFQYFGLHDLSEDETKRMHIVNEDGIDFLRESNKKFDLIINDAFTGKKEQRRDEESIQIIHDALHEKGIYIVNVPTALSGPFAKKGNAFRKLLQNHFKHTVLLATQEEKQPFEKQNVLMISSDSELL